MLNPKTIIPEINKASKNYFLESSFYLSEINNIKYRSTGNYTSKAINHNKNSNEEINVVKWFDDFWVYMEITFNPIDNKTVNTFFSLSVFEGSNDNNVKTQLFRAEWDTYDNDHHPQPHWHFYSNGVFENIVKDFEAIIDQEQSEFLEMIDKEKSKGIELKKMHFAMSALWNKNIDSHTHKISDDNELVKWYQGLLNHIKSQLEYAK